MRIGSNYTDLLTPFNSGRPNFLATIAATVQPFADLQAFFYQDLAFAFDLDTAIGVQLDAVGVRVGRSRILSTPIPGFYFTWASSTLGWSRGIWKGPYDTSYGIHRLDDITYRRLLRAKILANNWDGTAAGEQAILNSYFIDPVTHVFVVDEGISTPPLNWFAWSDSAHGWNVGRWEEPWFITRLAMSMTIGVAGKLPSIEDLELLGQDLIAAKPAGVTLTYRVTSVDNSPLMGWGMDSSLIRGWGLGTWGVTPEYSVAHPAVLMAIVSYDFSRAVETGFLYFAGAY